MALPKSIVSQTAAIRAGELSPEELVKNYLGRIARLDGDLRAWVLVDEEGARREAARLTAEAARGRYAGALHGIPVGIKDIIDVARFPTLAGSLCRAGHVAAADATIVGKLRSAGAIVLGKTVTTEYASFDPAPTRNPWNQSHTPGGSSSGSAAAVAAGMCAGAVGSQTGGSITRPAAYCGVCGLKPTWGRISLTGIVPLAPHLDHPGPICASVGDLELMYRAMAGYDPADPISVDRPVEEGDSTPPSLTAIRLARVAGYFTEHATADVQAATDRAVAQLTAAGADVSVIELPSDIARVVRSHRCIMATEAAWYHREQFRAVRDDYGPQITTLLDEGLATSAVDYAAALAHQFEFRRELGSVLARFDAILAPAATSGAPTIETTGDPRFNSPVSFAGVPTVSLPVGRGEDGMPIAVQLIGSAFAELPLLGVARACEAVFGSAATVPGIESS